MTASVGLMPLGDGDDQKDVDKEHFLALTTLDMTLLVTYSIWYEIQSIFILPLYIINSRYFISGAEAAIETLHYHDTSTF